MGEISNGLARALRTRDIPASVPARLRFLVKSQRGSTAAVARELGVSQRTVQRWIKGTTKPKPDAQSKIEGKVRSRWQPRVQDRQRKRAERDGFVVHASARFGFRSAAGSTDDPRRRLITQHLSGDVAQQLFAARDAGASEREQQEVIAEGLGYSYFRDYGRRAGDLQSVEFTGVEYIDFGI